MDGVSAVVGMATAACCKEYYRRQALTGHGGLPVYAYHKGHGFFGNIARAAIPFLRKHVLPAAVKAAGKAIRGVAKGEKVGKVLKRAAENVVDDAFKSISGAAGEPIKRAKTRQATQSIRKRRQRKRPFEAF